MSDLGWTLGEEGRYAEAENMERDAVNTGRRVLGSIDPITLVAMNNMAGIFQWQNHYADADKLYSEMIDSNIRGRGREHSSAIGKTHNMSL